MSDAETPDVTPDMPADIAALDFEAAYEADPLPKYLFNIGKCHQRMKSYAEAVGFLERYMEEAPEAEAPATEADAEETSEEEAAGDEAAEAPEAESADGDEDDKSA